jgi:RES domain
VVEVFADDEVIRPKHYRLAYPELTHPLRLLDLRRNGAMRAGTTPEISKTADYELPWDWSRYWYSSAACDSVDGILYYGARNDGHCVALYERAATSLVCDRCSIELGHPALRDELLRIADETGFRLVIN